MKRIVTSKLPPQNVKDPKTLRAQSEYVGRTTSVFIALFVVVIGILYFSTQTGQVVTTANISNTTTISCNIPLSSGVNYISLNCISNFQDRSEVLEKTDTTAITAMYEYRNNQADEWRVYAPNLPSYVVHDLKELSRLKGYIVIIENGNNTLIEYDGFLSSSSSIPLFEGNNFVGYPSLIVDSLPEALTTINNSFERVRYFNGTQYVEFNSTNNASENTLNNLTPTQGYWITVPASDSWQVTLNRTN